MQPTIQRLKQIRTITGLSGGTGRATPQSSHRDGKGQTLPQCEEILPCPVPFPYAVSLPHGALLEERMIRSVSLLVTRDKTQFIQNPGAEQDSVGIALLFYC